MWKCVFYGIKTLCQGKSICPGQVSVGSRSRVDPGTVPGVTQSSFHFYCIFQIFKGTYLYFVQTVFPEDKGWEALIFQFIKEIIRVGTLPEASCLYPVKDILGAFRILHSSFI